jgi:hypothetical protein
VEFRRANSEVVGSKLPDIPTGLTPVSLGAGKGWGTNPGIMATVQSSITVTTTGVIDWAQAGIFQYQLTTAQTFAPSFVNPVAGQSIILLLTQPSSSTAATLSTSNMGTIILGGTAASSISLTATNSAVDYVVITCVSPGTYVATLN